jgi:hypothetical protein
MHARHLCGCDKLDAQEFYQMQSSPGASEMISLSMPITAHAGSVGTFIAIPKAGY